jgi:hypothetical protein
VAGAAVVGGLITAAQVPRVCSQLLSLLIGFLVICQAITDYAEDSRWSEQVESYIRDGFVVCSGLIPGAIVDAAVDAIWEQMAAAPKPLEDDPWAKDTRPRPQRNDRASWGGWAGIVDGPAIVAAFTPQLIAVANALADAYEGSSPFRSVNHPITPPPQSLAINIFPATRGDDGAQPDWQWPGPHTDGAAERVEPRACRIQHMTYLQSSGEHGGGGTVAWPGSSRQLESLYMSDKQVSLTSC